MKDTIIVVVIVAFLGILLFFGVTSDIARQDWLNAHCSKIGKISGSSGFGTAITTEGKIGFVNTYTAGKTGYKCDDGMTYWE